MKTARAFRACFQEQAMNSCIHALWTGAMTLAFVPGLAAQPCTPHWAEAFPNAPVLSSEIRAVAMYDEGSGPRLFAAGHFITLGSEPLVGIARWNGDKWERVGGTTGLDGSGHWMGVLDDGAGPALYVGGSFSMAGTTPSPNFAKWDGAAWSAPATGPNGTVRGAAAFDDGSGPALYVIGLFDQVSGIPGTAGVARYSPMTGQWTSVGGGLSSDHPTLTPKGYSLAVLDFGDGPELYVGGQFTHAGGELVNNIARWNGRHWTALKTGLHGFDPLVMTITKFDDGFGPRLFVGGRFSLTTSGAQRPRVARFGPGGWVQVGADLSSSLTDYVNSTAILQEPGGPALYIGGLFAGATWLSQVNYVARLSQGEWVSVAGGMDSYLRSLVVADEPGGQALYAGGSFKFAGRSVAHRAARWDGQAWAGLEQHRGLIGLPYVVREFQDKVFVGGDLKGAGNRRVHAIAAWDGLTWSDVGGGLTNAGNSVPFVQAMHEYDDGSGNALYVTGRFGQAGGGPAFYIARWDGAHWSAVGGSGLGYDSYALEVHDDGSGPALYVGGRFETAGAVSVHRVARWNGQAWSAVGASSNLRVVQDLIEFDAGSGTRLYLRGSRPGPQPWLTEQVVMSWSGTDWTLVYGDVREPITTNLAVFDEGTGPALFAGLGTIQRWTGSAWSPPGLEQELAPWLSLRSLHAFDDGLGPGLFVAGGAFYDQPGIVYRRDGRWHNMGAGIGEGTVFALGGAALQSQRALFVAGGFMTVDGTPSAGFAEWRGCPLCPADCNGDGVLNLADFGCFQSRFALADPRADCNGDGILNLADFGCFQTRFALGCP